VTTGSTVYVAGPDPSAWRRRHSAQVLGAAVHRRRPDPERLEQARSFGCEIVDVSKGDPKEQVARLIGERLAEAINPPTKIPDIESE